jgi:hypothetical protein
VGDKLWLLISASLNSSRSFQGIKITLAGSKSRRDHFSDLIKPRQPT